jgi:hypothetical protein
MNWIKLEQLLLKALPGRAITDTPALDHAQLREQALALPPACKHAACSAWRCIWKMPPTSPSPCSGLARRRQRPVARRPASADPPALVE